MERIFWIGLAGAIGTCTRYLVDLSTLRVMGQGGFPYATLIVNLLGCFLIAAIMQIAIATSWINPGLRVILTLGFVGGLTTYSSFNYETTRLLDQGAAFPALANFIGTSVGCFLAGRLGVLVARQIARL